MAGDTRPPDRANGTQVASNSMTSAWAVDGASGKEVKMRSYAEIIAEEREQRNILEIKLTRLDETDGSEAKAKALTFDDIRRVGIRCVACRPVGLYRFQL